MVGAEAAPMGLAGLTYPRAAAGGEAAPFGAATPLYPPAMEARPPAMELRAPEQSVTSPLAVATTNGLVPVTIEQIAQAITSGVGLAPEIANAALTQLIARAESGDQIAMQQVLLILSGMLRR